MKKDTINFQKQYKETRECKATCSNCGYSATMMANTGFKICANCGYKMNNNSKARFKYMIMKLKGD